jgi:hypothetical protein
VNLLATWKKMQRWPGGQWLFSRAVCWKAPCFGTIKPRITRLEAGLCEPHLAQAGYGLPVLVEVKDAAGETVFDARVAMWLSPSSTPQVLPVS